MYTFSDRTTIPPSQTLTINALALEKRAKGDRIYNLSAGEPMIDTFPIIVEAAKQALDAGKTHYTPAAGVSELRVAAASWMHETYSTSYAKEHTIVTAGGKHGLSLLFDALLTPGDEVLIPAPYWVSYPSQVRMAGGKPVMINTTIDTGWKISPTDIKTHMTDRTRVLLLNNASNPTGVLYTREELEALLAMAASHNLLVISDEVYSGLVYDDALYTSCGSFSAYQDTVIVVQSMSKHFAMTGWRVGFVFAHEDIIRMLIKLQGQTTSGASTISQWAALAGVHHAEDIIRANNTEMQKRRDVLRDVFAIHVGVKIDPAPAGLYQFISLPSLGSTVIDSVAFCTDVLTNANVAMVPGVAFGAEGYVRCSFGEQQEELVAAVEALALYLEKQ